MNQILSINFCQLVNSSIFGSHESSFAFVAVRSIVTTKCLDFASAERNAAVYRHLKCYPMKTKNDINGTHEFRFIQKTGFQHIQFIYLNIDRFKKIDFKVIFMRFVVSGTKSIRL